MANGLESSGPQLGRIDPSSLIGRPDTDIVSPRNTAILSDAFRQGFITAEDIVERVGERGKAKKKLELQLAQEQISPEAQEARKTVMLAAGARAKQALAEAKRAEELAPLRQRAERAKTVRGIMEEETLGGSEKLAAALNAAQVEIPKTPEGFIDVDRAREISQDVVNWQRYLNNLLSVSSAIKWEKRDVADSSGKKIGEETAPFNTALGRFLTDSEFGELSRRVREAPTFKEWQMKGKPATALGGGVSPTAVPATAAAALPPTDQMRAQLVEKAGVEPTQAAGLDQAQVAEQFKQLFPSATVKPAPTTTGVSIEPRQLPGRMTAIEGGKSVPVEGVSKLVLGAQAADKAVQIDQTLKELLEKHPLAVGFITGRIGQWAGSPQWNEDVANFQSKVTAILAPVAKGTYNETGVLSDKDVERYNKILPALKQNPKVALTLSRNLMNEVATNFSRQLDFWDRLGYDVGDLKPEGERIMQQAQQQVGAPATAAAPSPPSGEKTEKIINVKGKQYRVIYTPGQQPQIFAQ